ncbi:S41 family peptidase [Gimesia fumaroli]|jgi:carboxyl-terminal processing protease|uniref:Putative CtpA-like serine protease n=1 Tax=Gimesia fumaroli TaxID=2527976 RepID=A0A518IL98_9PLAN|nr:S41 family peptidase [Gimesia fumaroli]QDV53856.1 putative CtpA-like serine protease [Gimesia fumaroli]
MNRSQFKISQNETINSARLFVWGMVILMTAVFLSGCTTLAHADEYQSYQDNHNRRSYDQNNNHSLEDLFPPAYSRERRHQRQRPVREESGADDYQARLEKLLYGNDQQYDRPRNRYENDSRERPYSSPKRQNRDSFEDDYDSQKLRELIRELRQRSLPQYDRDRYETRFPNQTPVDPNQELRNKISQRYSSPSVVTTLQNLDSQRAYSFYLEVNRMIDSRHVQPPSYDVRTKKSLQNLIIAVENQQFMSVNRISVSPERIQMAQRSWQQLMNQNPARNAQEAVTVMRQAADIAGSQLQLPATAVISEFTYGSLEALDKHSRFEFTPSMSGPRVDAGGNNIVGVGVQLKTHREGAVILRTLKGGSAEKAGLQRGDVIVGANQRSFRGLSLDEVASLITGPAGSSVSLDVRRGDRDAIVNLSRQSIRITNISEVKMVDAQQKIGLIRLEKFGEGAVQELDQALWNLHRQGMKSLVFDLRGNPGGLLTEAISISNRFVPSGQIVSTRGRNQGDNSVESATHAQTWKMPLVVLVDGDSASASEIFAAAVQENRRGLIIGRKTYGKGTVQTHFPLQSVSGTFWLTTAKFYSPTGREMAGAGVTPDVQVNMSERELEEIGPLDRDLKAGVSAILSQRPGELVNNLPARQQGNPVRFQFSG